MKAYDLKDLMKRLQGKGLDVLEDAGIIVYDTVKEWLVESSQVSTYSLDKPMPMVFAALDPIVYEQIDKIDGKQDIPEA